MIKKLLISAVMGIVSWGIWDPSIGVGVFLLTLLAQLMLETEVTKIEKDKE